MFVYRSLCKADYESTDNVQCLTFSKLDVTSFENEDAACYQNVMYLPKSQPAAYASITFESFSTNPVDFMIADLKFMLEKFKSDETYQSIVYRILQSLMVPEHVLALTHNSVLGLLWRLICNQRQDDRREVLLNTLSNTLSTMDSDARFKADAPLVRAWLEESYNAKEEILERIAKVSEHLPALILTLDQQMERRELMEISRSCNPQVLRSVMNLLNHLTVVTNQNNLPSSYLPLKMEDKDIFELLPHLLAEGLKFSLRPAAIMAMLCILSKNRILSERAKHFLLSIKGKWIDKEASENYSYSFIKIAVQLPQFFTDNENDFFQTFALVGGLKINASTNVTIKQAFHPKVAEIHKDTKITCSVCNLIRSTTLFPDVAIGCCAFCLDENSALKNTLETGTNDTSHLAQCRSCVCLYAVVQFEKLRCAPKCYYCRKLRTVPYRRCTGCSNKYVHYDSTKLTVEPGEELTFLCAECQELGTSQSIVDSQVEIQVLIQSNKAQIYSELNIQVEDKIDFLSNEWSLFKLKDKIRLVETQENKSTTVQLMYKQKPVLNGTEVLDQIRTWVKSGRAEVVTCYICCDDVRRNQISQTCGNKSCHADACLNCLAKWYEATKPGSIVLPVHLLCPFCKQTPNAKVLKRFNRQACSILKIDLKNEIDEHWYYGWCVDCYRIKKAQEKACTGDGVIPVLNGFVCEECDALRQTSHNRTIKYCPGMNEDGKSVCGMAIEKKGGCNHITCTTCDSHWCWLCVKMFEADTIYEHLNEAHGNYGFDDDEHLDY